MKCDEENCDAPAEWTDIIDGKVVNHCGECFMFTFGSDWARLNGTVWILEEYND